MRKVIIAVMLFAAVCMANQMQRDMLLFARLASRRSVDAWDAAGLNEGLVSYWAMRTNTAVNVVTDEYGTNNATAFNSPTFSAANGVRDNGVGLVGASNQTIVREGAVLTNPQSSAWTIAYWATVTTSGFHVSMYSQSRLDPFLETTVRTNSVFYQLRNNDAAPSSAHSFPHTKANSAWVHVAVVHNGSNLITAYSDGISLGTQTQTVSGTYTLNRTVLGGRVRDTPFNYSFMPTGALDEVAIWNRALSSNEVWNLYNTPLYAPYKQ